MPGTYEGGLIAGWLPWISFGQEPYWNWCAQRLLSVGPDGVIVYELAKSVALSADGKEYTFTLVPDAKWHDGTPVTAADVAFTYNTTLKAKAGSNIGGTDVPVFSGARRVVDDNTKDASGIQVVDDLTIKFLVDAPNAQFLPQGPFAILRIAPKHLFDGMALEDYAKQPISTDALHRLRAVQDDRVQVQGVRATSRPTRTT